MPLRLLKKLSKKILGIPTRPESPKEAATTSADTARPARVADADTRTRRPSRPQKERRPASSPVRKEPPAAPWSVSDFDVPPEEGKSRFHDFALSPEIMHALQDLDFRYCTPIQAKVLTHVKAGQNVAGRAQTGTGKTAAFLIEILSRFEEQARRETKPGTPRALVIAPTRELVIQIVKDAEDLGKYLPFHYLAVYGGMDFVKQQRQLQQGTIDLIAATPGRLLDFQNRGMLDLRQVEVLVIDEADRMLDMGFIPDVRRIIRSLPPKDRRRTMLFSATLTEDVRRLASQWMPDPVMIEIEPEQVTVDTIEQKVYAVAGREKFRLVYNLLQQPEFKRVLIFGNRRDDTQRLAENLKRHGVPCELLTGAVMQTRRLHILEEFRSGKIPVVVATDVAGRGLHIDNITHVINYDFPYEPEDYVHRIGRTGRAGVKGVAISFACESESFIIPDIEQYIGRPLSCAVPEEALLRSPPRPVQGPSVKSRPAPDRVPRRSDRGRRR